MRSRCEHHQDDLPTPAPRRGDQPSANERKRASRVDPSAPKPPADGGSPPRIALSLSGPGREPSWPPNTPAGYGHPRARWLGGHSRSRSHRWHRGRRLPSAKLPIRPMSQIRSGDSRHRSSPTQLGSASRPLVRRSHRSRLPMPSIPQGRDQPRSPLRPGSRPAPKRFRSGLGRGTRPRNAAVAPLLVRCLRRRADGEWPARGRHFRGTTTPPS